ncbi:protein of unknown function (plasmid) [Caballeronia sp. S22]
MPQRVFRGAFDGRLGTDFNVESIGALWRDVQGHFPALVPTPRWISNKASASKCRQHSTIYATRPRRPWSNRKIIRCCRPSATTILPAIR